MQTIEWEQQGRVQNRFSLCGSLWLQGCDIHGEVAIPSNLKASTTCHAPASSSLGSGLGFGSRLGTGSSSGLLLGSSGIGGGGVGDSSRTRTASPSYVRTSPNRIRFGGSEPHLSEYETGSRSRPAASTAAAGALSSSYGGGVRSSSQQRKYWY